MLMNWNRTESAERPDELATKISKKYNYIRKNITEVQKEQPDGSTMTMYEYDELEVLKTDWELFETVSESATRISEVEDAVIELAELIGGE